VANNPSAEKRNRQKDKRRARNKTALSALRTAIKKARNAIDGKTEEAKGLVQFAVSTIDKAVTKGVLKRETASRYISRLSQRSNKSSSDAT
jgi:small subunit ribosomal protein S20